MSDTAFPYRDYQRDALQVKAVLQRTRFWLYLVLVTIVLTPLVSFWYYQNAAKAELVEQFKTSKLALASALVSQLDADKHANLLITGKRDPAYAALLLQISQAALSQADIINISTVILRGDDIQQLLSSTDSNSFLPAVQTDKLQHIPFINALEQHQPWYLQYAGIQGELARACAPFPEQHNNYPAMLCIDSSTALLSEHSAAMLKNISIIAALTLLISLCVVYSVLQHQHQYRLSLELLQKQRDLFLSSALTDPLTNALNRRAFHIVYASAQSQLQRNNLPFAVIILDIDHFKLINDQHGHDYGDQVLAKMVAQLQSVLRSSDHLARLGGEEFCIICNIPDRDSAMAMAEKLRLTAMINMSENTDDKEKPITVSLGIYLPQLGENMHDALKRADAALYAAKASGRNRAVIFDASLTLAS